LTEQVGRDLIRPMNHSQNLALFWVCMSVVLVFGVPGVIGVVRDQLREQQRQRDERSDRARDEA
jgi:hypothetical protein